MTEIEKEAAIKYFVELMGKQTLELFSILGLKSHIEATIVDAAGEEYEYVFRKIEKGDEK